MPGALKTPKTLYDKVLQAHVVDEKQDGTLLLYIGTSNDFGLFLVVVAATKKQLTFLLIRSPPCT